MSKDGHRIRNRDDVKVMCPTRVVLWDPCPLGLPESLTLAHVALRNRPSLHGNWVFLLSQRVQSLKQGVFGPLNKDGFSYCNIESQSSNHIGTWTVRLWRLRWCDGLRPVPSRPA